MITVEVFQEDNMGKSMYLHFVLLPSSNYKYEQCLGLDYETMVHLILVITCEIKVIVTSKNGRHFKGSILKPFMNQM